MTKSRWVEVATIYELPEGGVHVVEVEQMEIALFRRGGTIYALEDRCTHADVPLSDGYVEDGAVHCPLHGARFDLATGAALCPPAYEATRAFAVRRRDEFIDIQIDDPPQEHP